MKYPNSGLGAFLDISVDGERGVLLISEFGLDKRKKEYSEEKLSQLAQIQHACTANSAVTSWHHFSDT